MRKLINKNKASKAGFTLLELLVVVAILAAIAGTASIALKDTDARAAAAAHVAMMDEINKGVRTFRVLQRNTLPTRFDSLLSTTDGTATDAAYPGSDQDVLGFDSADITVVALTEDQAGTMSDGGLESLMYLSPTGDPADDGDCNDIPALIASRGNAVVAGNIFLPPDANGCGVEIDVGTGIQVATWNGDPSRISGDAADTRTYYMFGVGPACSLFDQNTLGALTSVPVYRHVGATQYNRFVALFAINEGQLEFVSVVDGALDTKEEELGEWDGTRNTI